MKRIEDIEKMAWEELESASLQEEIPLPDGLEERIKLRLAAQTALEEKPEQRSFSWVPYAALAAAAAVAAGAVIPRSSERVLLDTYDDPYLAYAQVEATFEKISHKMSCGVRLAAKADETADRTIQILQKVTEK